MEFLNKGKMSSFDPEGRPLIININTSSVWGKNMEAYPFTARGGGGKGREGKGKGDGYG